jgi:hypothetical protein
MVNYHHMFAQFFGFFLDLMDVRHQVQGSIESHGGKVIEKMPNTV